MTSTTEQTGTLRDASADAADPAAITIFDADVHVHESPAEMAEYAPEPWSVALKTIARMPERYLDLPGMSPNPLQAIPWPGGPARSQLVLNAAQLRSELDDMSIGDAVLFPDHLLLLACVVDRDFAATLASSYNQWLYERWLSADPTLKGALVIAPQDPEAGAADIRRHADHAEFACVYLPAAAVRPLYGHRCYDPVYKAASDAGLPVVMHSVSTLHPAFPFNVDGFETTAMRHAIAHPFAMMANTFSMIETGVPVRFPDLRIGIMEAGISWIPFVMHKIDKEYIERRRELAFYDRRPSEYIAQWYFGTQPIEEPERRGDIVKMFELFDGENRAMFASDWPHHDFDHPQHVLGLPFSDDAKRKIMGGNARRFFRLG